jgi:2-polyprenyl-3-methyl-5-hydroxy-6-metoxy-1,4-benzoquinol methylase
MCMFRSSLKYLSMTSSSMTSAQTTIDKDELAKFSSAASDWWNSSSALINPALHTLNALRIPLVRNALVSRKTAVNQEISDAETSVAPLSGMTVLDVGCGGGILSEVSIHSSSFLDITTLVHLKSF